MVLTTEEEFAAAEVARKIFLYCKERDRDIDGCVACRLAGLQYMKDLARHLPPLHRFKDEERIDEITELIKRESMSRLKE